MLNAFEFQKLNQQEQQAYIKEICKIQIDFLKTCIVARFESGFNKTYVTTDIFEVIANLKEVFKKEILREPTIEECYFHEIEEAQRMCGQFIRS